MGVGRGQRRLERILKSPRPLRVNATAAEMFRSVASTQKFPASLALRNLGNPILLSLAAKRLSADKLTNAILRDTISLNVLKAGYKAIVNAVHHHAPGAGVFPLLVPGATDGRYWRQRGYAAYGFGPAILDRADINRPHGIDERISIDNLALGINIARDMIRELCA